uniref:Uncharacterized protein n=1 Tax=Caenorhabditis japonica TaxID=281687 RepID=A0A8R1DIK6_CAEJA
MISNHAKVLLTVIALVGFIAAEWTKDMEHYRKANCGQRELPKADKDEGTVVLTEEDPIVQVTTRDTKEELVKAHGAGGIYVSRRHIITSAQAVLTGDKKWLFDGDKFDQGLCNEEKHLIVPEKYRKQIVVRSGHCITGGCSYVHKTVDKAIIMFMCTPDKNKFSEDYATMVLEFSQDMSEEYACIADRGIRLTSGDIVLTYGFQYEEDDFVNSELIYRQIKVKKFTDSHSERFIMYNKIYALGDRGGPMLYFKDSRWWLVGVGGTNGLKDRAGETYNFEVRNYQTPLCSLFSLCGRANINDKLPDPFKIKKVTTDAPTTTELPTTTTTILEEEPTAVEPVPLAKPAPRVVEPIAKTDPPPKATTFIPNPTTAKPQAKKNGPVFTADPKVVEKPADKPPVAQPYIAGVVSSSFWNAVVLSPLYLLFNF